jgi:hypothetical protein
LPATKIYVENLASNYFKNAASADALAKTDVRYGVEVYHEWNQDNPNKNLPWGEIWLNCSARSTNFGWATFESYVLFAQPKIGIHLGEGIGAYLRGDITSSNKEGSDYSFLNVADYGVGIKFEPWRKMGKLNDLLRKFKMYVEILGVSYLKDPPADPSKVVSSDVRFGIDFSYGR